MSTLLELDETVEAASAVHWGTPIADYRWVYPVSGDDTALDLVQGKALVNRTRAAILSTPALMQEARGWFADCTAYDCDVSEYSDTEVLNYVARNYSYGLMGFYLASRTLTPAITRKAVGA